MLDKISNECKLFLEFMKSKKDPEKKSQLDFLDELKKNQILTQIEVIDSEMEEALEKGDYVEAKALAQKQAKLLDDLMGL